MTIDKNDQIVVKVGERFDKLTITALPENFKSTDSANVICDCGAEMTKVIGEMKSRKMRLANQSCPTCSKKRARKRLY